MSKYKQLEDEFGMAVLPKRDLVVVKGENAKLYSAEDKEYIDCIAGNGSVNFGHSNQEIVSAIKEQSGKLITAPNMLYNDKRALLLEKLIGIAPKSLKKGFLCNSGTEAIEAAIKFAMLSTGKKGFVCAMRGFHGRTLGALSATHNSKHREDFEPLLQGFNFVPFNNFEKLEEQIDGDTAAVILEIVQGEAGVYVGDKEYFQQVQKLCQEKNVLLIIDEVQTGFARTGKNFACEYFDLQPDILCLAKSIANGLPMGAVLCSDNVQITPGKHGTTFGGNALACAASIATIDFMVKNNMSEEADKKGSYLLKKLKEIDSDKIREIRGLGLMIGIELKEKVTEYINELMEKGILVLPAGLTTIRLLPPLTISYEELDLVVSALKEVLE